MSATGTPTTIQPAIRSGTNGTIERLLSRVKQFPCAARIHTADDTIVIGDGAPCFDLFVQNARGMKAIRSLNELEIIEAYMRGDLDIEGDFVRAMSFQQILSDRAFWIKTWRRLRPVVIGRERCNPAWIAKHYDSGNAQLIATDSIYETYTPGLYEDEGDTLEEGAHRKLRFAFESLRLKREDSLLDVGCGWGGFMRYCAERGVRPTGITLSKDQLEYARQRIRDANLDGDVIYQDFFTYEPTQRFDAISMMGVMEDLSDYGRVMSRISRWLEPGGRVYLDFATERTPFSTSSFITKYIWPGTFRKVYLPELISAIWASPFEIVALYNDRRNYDLWSKKVHERWVERKSDALQQVTEETWRMFRVLFAAAESIMSGPSLHASAQRLVLELPPARHRSLLGAMRG
jgi:cyclopropane-fatty-acyl-phospholipid synthase